MRISYLSGSFIPGRMANSVQVTRMCHEFARLGHEVELFAIQGQAGGQSPHDWYGISEAVELRLLAWPPRFGLGSIRYSRAVLRDIKSRQRPDLLYGRHLLALYLARNLGVPLVYEAHLPAPDPWRRLVQERLFRHPSFARLVTVSHALAADYRRRYPFLAEDKILVAPNGADEPTARSAGAKVSLPGRPGHLRVGYMGSFYPHKGIATVQALAARQSAVDFYLIGGSPSAGSEEPLHPVLENMHYLGFIAPRDVAKYLAGMDIVVAPYRHLPGSGKTVRDDTLWGSPLKIFEYMAAGACIIASDLPIVREVLTHGENCLLCGPEDVAAWISALDRLRSDEKLRRRLQEGARRRFVEHYSRGARARRVLAGLAGNPTEPVIAATSPF
jgi:glycosyltransferase involved in cell wall biosynthesis